MSWARCCSQVSNRPESLQLCLTPCCCCQSHLYGVTIEGPQLSVLSQCSKALFGWNKGFAGIEVQHGMLFDMCYCSWVLTPCPFDADVMLTTWSQDNMASSMMAPAVFAMLLLAVAVFQLICKPKAYMTRLALGAALWCSIAMIQYSFA